MYSFVFIPLACAGLVPGVLSVARAQSDLQDSLRQKQGIEHRLTKLVIAGVEEPLPPQAKITLKIVAEGLAGGKSAVNLYFGGFKMDEAGSVHWNSPGFAVTMMAGPEDLMNLEQQFLGALQSTQWIRVLGRGLTFETEGSATQLTFEEVNPEPQALENVLGKKLVLARMIVDGKETALPGEPELTLLASDGRVSGKSGVNSYTGSYKLLSDDGIEFPRAFATTRMAGPPELMDLENSFLKALSAVERIHPNAGGVVLENDAKTILLEFVLR
jgi:heat shock protein HslJ